MTAAIAQLPPVRRIAGASAGDIAALVAASEPAILTGVIDGWPALAAGRQSPTTLDRYLKAMDRGAMVPVMEAPPSAAGRFGYTADLREFSFSKRQRPLAETLDRIARTIDDPAAPVIAIQMLKLADALPGFVRDNPMPLLPAEAGPRLWLGGPVHTQIHNDRDHNLACVIAGRRRFTLFPPDQVGNLYIGPLDNPPALSLVDAEAPDLDRFPRFAEALATAQIAELGPGDALLMPRHWWHHVVSRDRYNAMVNYWWGSNGDALDDPFNALLAAMLSVKALPDAEQRYWRAMFEHHVFERDGATAEGSRDPARRPLSLASRRALRQQLRERFSR